MKIACTEFEEQVVAALGGRLDENVVDNILQILDAATEDSHSDGYSEGLDDGSSNIEGKIEDGISDATDGLLENLRIGLGMIDTDRASAKVYLDRATRTLGHHLIEVSPCLL